jgi:outer membrane immunogenic protein
MKKIAYLAVATLLAASSVYAGGQTMEPTSSSPSWTGFYLGADAGYMWGTAGLYDLNSSYHASNVDNPFSYDPNGGLADLHAGYQHLFRDRYLLGGEMQGGWMGLDGKHQYPPYIGNPTRIDNSIASTSDGGFFSLAARLGFVAKKHMLFYAKGGYVWTGIRSTFTDTNPTGITLSQTTRPSRDGSLVGAGVEYAFNDKWSIRGEYDHYDFGTAESTGLGSNGTTYYFKHKLSSNAIAMGFSRKI